MKIKRIYLRIKTWVGSCAIGAQHYYGTLEWDTIKNRKIVELERTMTAKEIKAHNEEMEEGGLYELKISEGNTHGYFSEEEVVRAGVAKAKELFQDKEVILIKCDPGNWFAVPVLFWPDHFQAQAKRLNELAETWEKVGGYEGNESAADAADKEWQEILEAHTEP